MVEIKKCLACLLAMLLLVSCARTGEKSALRFDLRQAPASIDPQTTQEESSLLIIANTFEGLTKLSKNGEAQPACAKSWSVSPDGLVYTFKLREGLLWEGGIPLTAEDFVFALRRIADPATDSPMADRFLGIKNSAKIRAGVLPTSMLGAFAPSVDTVIIELERPDSHLPALMADTAAMPCSQKFFNSQKGRYGLSASAILTNGAFSIKSWDSEIITLHPNNSYVKPPTINRLYLCYGRGDAVDLYLEGRSEACIVPQERIKDINGSVGIPILDQGWVLLINPKSEIGASRELRHALVSALNMAEIQKKIPLGGLPAQGLIPPISMLSGKNYRKMTGAVTPVPPMADPLDSMMTQLASQGLTKPPRTTLLVSNFEPGPDLGGTMQRMWSESISTYINMEQLSYGELTKRVSAENFDIALTPMASSDNSPEEYLRRLGSYTIDYQGEELTVATLLERLRLLDDTEAAADGYRSIEQGLVDNCIAVPVYDAPSLFVQSSKVSGISYAFAQRTVYFGDAVWLG